jgi:hypothetical protein
MGYRSEVTIAFYDGKASRGWEVLDMLKDRFPMLFEHWPEGHWECGRDVGSPAVFRAEYVKWYTDEHCYRDVRAMMDTLKELADDTDTESAMDCIHWEFARIGEDVSDTEYLTSPHAANHIRIERYATVHMTLG